MSLPKQAITAFIATLVVVASVSAESMDSVTQRAVERLRRVERSLKIQWEEDRVRYEASQQWKHEQATEIREILCLLGDTDKCPEVRTIGEEITVDATFYNPECHQTDGGVFLRTENMTEGFIKRLGYRPTLGACVSYDYYTGEDHLEILGDPCKGSSGIDVCHYAEQDVHAIAVSPDLLSILEYGDRVRLESDNPHCSGEFEVMDKMNARYSNRIDIFRMERSDNQGTCYNVKMVKVRSVNTI